MKIAIVGGGVAGIVAARSLYQRHEITLFEADDRPGGHSHTITVERESGSWSVDTGFIVLNDRNYPQFTRLLDEAGVATQPTHMGFSVKGEDEDFEYAGTPRGLFCQPSNLGRPAFWRMLSDLRRFNRALRSLLHSGEEGPSLADWLDRHRFSQFFIDRLIVPQAAAVWSADPRQMRTFPVRFLAEFFDNHGMLGLRGRPQWSTVTGGAQSYVHAFTAPFADRLRLSSPVAGVSRDEAGVTLRVQGGGEAERFDEVVFACHADQALAILDDPSDREHALLSAFPYQANEAALHTDASLLPRRRAARQAWNFHLFAEPRDRATVTYSMNHLQRLDADEEFCVTLNLTERIDPAKLIARIPYMHPVYTPAGVAAQQRWDEISGIRRTHYCGAYWGWGFHEDGVVSAQRACARLAA